MNSRKKIFLVAASILLLLLIVLSSSKGPASVSTIGIDGGYATPGRDRAPGITAPEGAMPLAPGIAEGPASQQSQVRTSKDAGTIATTPGVVRIGNINAVTTEPFQVGDAAERAASKLGGRTQSRVDSDGRANRRHCPPVPMGAPYQEDMSLKSPICAPDAVRSVNLTLRIPESAFEQLLADVKALPLSITHLSINTSDVSEQLVDMAARLRAKEIEVERYRVLLAKADKIDDILRVSTAFTQSQTQLEQLGAAQRRLSEQVAFSTLSLTLADLREAAVTPPSGYDPLRSAERAFATLVRLGAGLLDAGIYLLILSAPLLLLVVAWRFWERRRRTR